MKNAKPLSADAETPCPERVRLERDHDHAAAALESAHAAGRAKIGISLRDEFARLEREAEEAWMHLQRARRALSDHIRDHGCEGFGAKSTSVRL